MQSRFPGATVWLQDDSSSVFSLLAGVGDLCQALPVLGFKSTIHFHCGTGAGGTLKSAGMPAATSGRGPKCLNEKSYQELASEDTSSRAAGISSPRIFRLLLPLLTCSDNTNCRVICLETPWGREERRGRAGSWLWRRVREKPQNSPLKWSAPRL